MKSNNTRKLNTFIGMLVLGLIVGCGGENFSSVPVSGTVTMDGKPIAGVAITFYPEATESTSIVGPFSEAVTDSEGKFELKTRYGDPGAVVGQHRISFEYAGVDPEDLAAAESELAEAKAEGGDTAAAQAAVDKQKGATKGKIKIPRRYSDEQTEVLYTVPPGGADNVEFPLTSK
ncbi:MAG: carboxypeptidase-like regulatory domain-containing protein [Mariniblastus sp.]|nr:carboxypeptidase-like regulatory domain-containing protein [Mariniblastus sp.]